MHLDSIDNLTIIYGIFDLIDIELLGKYIIFYGGKERKVKELIIREKNIVKERLKIKNVLISELGINNKFHMELVTVNNIEHLIKLYDSYILDNYLSIVIPNGIRVSVSNRMTSSGGKTIYTKAGKESNYEIRLSLKILQASISGNFKKRICGIEGKDLIDTLMLIIEHELCHVLEFSFYGDSSCKGIRFKALAWKIFRHSTSYHEISINNESNTAHSEDIKIERGQKVGFSYKGTRLEGIVWNINKRATVMVEDKNGTYKDSNGIKYTKWYVPINFLI